MPPPSRNHKHDEQWNARFEELLKYKSEHGDCNVPRSQGKLGVWVNSQRSAFKDSLAQDRIDRLNSIGFMWSSALKRPLVPWETRFSDLVQYKAKHGDCRVPRSQGPFGIWVNYQRALYKNNKLSQDRVDRLNSIGFPWSLTGRPGRRKALPSTQEQSSMRNERVSSLGTDVDPVPVAAGASSVEANRLKGGDGASELSEERVKKLDDLGFNCRTTSGVAPTWQDRYNELKEYKSKHGDCNVPLNQGPLGLWVSIQRKHKYTLLSKERVQLLNEIGLQ